MSKSAAALSVVFLLSLLCSPAFSATCPSAETIPLESSAFRSENGRFPVVGSWLRAAIIDSLSFGANNCDKMTRRAKIVYFTKEGYQPYTNMTEMMKRVIMERTLLQQFALLGVPVLIEHGLNKDNIYTWRYKISGLITWSGVKPVVDTKPASLIVTVVRTNDLPYGLGISNIQVAE